MAKFWMSSLTTPSKRGRFVALLSLTTAVSFVLYQTLLSSPGLLTHNGRQFGGQFGHRLHAQRQWQECRKVLSISGNRFNWEQEDGQSRCKKTYRSVDEMQQGMQKLRQLTPSGRQVKLVFIGDSRIRILHESLTQRLSLKPDNLRSVPIFYEDLFFSREELQRAIPPREKLADLQEGCLEAHILHKERNMIRCTLGAGDDTLRSEFWWRPYLKEQFGQRLDWLLAECAQGRCPNLVVMDSGPWYAKVTRFAGDNTSKRTVQFIADLAIMREKIARLAATTKLLWKMDEPYMPDLVYGRKMNVTRGMMVLSSVVYDTAVRIPELNLWTSDMVESTWFYHQVCLAHRKELIDTPNSQIRQGCFDPMHAGEAVRWKMLQSIFNVLLFNVTSHTRDFCCGS